MKKLTNDQWSQMLSIRKDVVCSAQAPNRPRRLGEDIGGSMTITISSSVFPNKR